MPWIVGIDEAGYGPNLGPLVMTSVACRVPEWSPKTDFWQLLQAAVRRFGEADDGRLLVEDSKVVYAPNRGLLDLEMAVLTLSAPERTQPAQNGVSLRLASLIDRVCPACHADLRAEPWYSGASPLPVAAEPARLRLAARLLSRASAANGVTWAAVRSVVVCPLRFNRLLDQWGSKADVLRYALGELLRCNRFAEDEAVHFYIDKHGGRNTYAAMLQDALGEGMVVAHAEGMNRSAYSVLGVGREVRLTFQPRADAEHFGVALASMVSKYLREVLMREFNDFWTAKVPGLEPTAGYPGDALRFWHSIRPVADQLHIPEDALWRRK